MHCTSSRLCSRRAREGCAMRCGGRTRNCCSEWAEAHSSVAHIGPGRAAPPPIQLRTQRHRWIYCGSILLSLVLLCFCPSVRSVRDHFVVVRRNDVAAVLRARRSPITPTQPHPYITPAHPSLHHRLPLSLFLRLAPYSPSIVC